MKKLFLFIAFLFSISTISADTYFEIDNTEVPYASLGKRLKVPVKAHFSGRLNAWQIYFTLPEGLTLFTAQSTSQMNVYFYDSEGELDSITPSVSTGSIPTVLSVIMTSGYWDPDGDGEFECYGPVKWEAGDYDNFFNLYFNVSSDFKGGELIMQTYPSSSYDLRGGTIIDTGDQGLSFITTTVFTLEQIKPGDVDGNGSLSIADVTVLVDYLIGFEVDIVLDAADVNGDQDINIADVTSIVDQLLNQ